MSFKKKLDELYQQRLKDKEHISWTSKLELRKLVDDKYLPKIYQVADKAEDLTEPNLKKYVVKPAKGAANRGVYPINNGINDFTKKKITWGQIIRGLKTQNGFKPPYFIEEYIGSNPDNWEMYCFKGQVGLVRQRRNLDRVEKRYKFYDVDFNNLGLIELSKEKVLDESLPLPQNPKGLIEAAQEISKNLEWSFCRVDLFDGQKIYLNELTMHPGLGNNFTPEVDKMLGDLWQNNQ